jgi:tyrosine-protein kinase Etk/Wzc
MDQRNLNNIGLDSNEENVEHEFNILDYLRIALQYRFLIIGVFIIIVVGNILYTNRQPRIYQATCTILLEENMNNDFFMLSPTSNSKKTINNNIVILKSTPVAALAYQILLKNPQGDKLPITKSANPISSIKEIEAVSVRDSDVLSLSYESTSPLEAMIIVNSVAEALYKQNTQYARRELTNIRQFLENQLDTITRRLQTSEEELRAYKLEYGLVQLDNETEVMIQKSSDTKAEFEKAETELLVKNKQISYLKSQLSEQDSLLVNVNYILTTPYIAELQKGIIETQALLSNLLTKNEYKSSHPQIIQLNNEIAKAKIKLNDEITKMVAVREGISDPLIYRADLIKKIATVQVEKQIAEAQVEGLRTVVENYDQMLTTIPDKELELARLTRNLMLDEKIYSMMVEKYEDSKVAEQAKIGNIRIIETAELPTSPIKPNKKRNFIIGIVMGLGAGMGLAFAVHTMDTKLKTVEDIYSYVKLPILGTIPMIHESESQIAEMTKMIENAQGENKRQLQKNLAYVGGNLISHYSPKSPVAESYRTLRTNVMSRKKGVGPLTILVTSSGPKEGKSTTASNVAITFANMNTKVCLIDLDLRRPTVHSKFDLKKEFGVSDMLIEDDYNLEKYVKKTDINNLDIITSGFIPPNPAELISSPNMDKLLAALKEKYDYIVFDTPPVVAVTDAMILAKKVDMKIIVIRIGKTEKQVFLRTKELFKNVDEAIDGVVVNGIYTQKYYSKYKHNYYYYYYYYYYYGEQAPKRLKKKGLSKLLGKD